MRFQDFRAQGSKPNVIKGRYIYMDYKDIKGLYRDNGKENGSYYSGLRVWGLGTRD